MTKHARNTRIVRLRDHSWRINPGTPLTWAFIAMLVSREFPDDPIGESQARKIYKRETK